MQAGVGGYQQQQQQMHHQMQQQQMHQMQQQQQQQMRQAGMQLPHHAHHPMMSMQPVPGMQHGAQYAGMQHAGGVGVGIGAMGGVGMGPVGMDSSGGGMIHEQPMEPMGMAEMDGFDWEQEREDQKRILLPLRRPVNSLFMPDSLRDDFSHQNHLLMARLQPEDREFYRLPMTVDHERYHSLWPLPPSFDQTPNSHSNQFYKVTQTKDGLHYVLRRVAGNHSEKHAAKAIAPWIRIAQLANGTHPNIVPVRTVFESQDFDEGKCLCFVYDYYPAAEPIATHYQLIQPETDTKEGFPSRGVVPEHVLWSYYNQLVTALTTVHSQGLAAFNISPSRVLVKDNRLRINFCGVNEALQLVPKNQSRQKLQFEDLKCICRLLMAVACRRYVNSQQTEVKCFQVMQNSYSEDMCELLKFVLFTQHTEQQQGSDGKQKGLPTVWDLQGLSWHRLVDELQQTYTHIDYLQNQLAKEHQNGRLFSLIAKLGFINERPEHKNNPKWSETGDRYLVKLFRDFIFHTQDEAGRPTIDLGHVVNCLNKLDAASNEKTLLTGRNQDSMLIVSYKELNRCIKAAFRELKEAAEADPEQTTASQMHYQ